MQGQKLSILQFLEILSCLLSFREYYNLFVPIRLYVCLYVLEHLLLPLVQYRLIHYAFGYLIRVITNQIDQDGLEKPRISEFLNESRDCR